MRDCSTNRAGFDRVLMAVAATFLAVSATSALAGPSDTPRASAAELAIDAAIPRPEPANVPPPSIGDFKMDSTASVPDAAKAIDKATAKPSEPSRTCHRKGRRTRYQAGRDRHRAREGQRHRNRTASGCNYDACDRHGAGCRTRQGACEGCEQRRPGRSAGCRQTARNAGRQIAALFRSQERARGRREVLLGA